MPASPRTQLPPRLMAQHFFKLARVLLGRDRPRDIRDRAEWFVALDDGAV